MQRRAGAVDNEAQDEDDALAQLRRFLSYLPSSVWELPPVVAGTDPPDRREEALLSIVPRDTRPLLCAWARQAHRLVAHEAAAARRRAGHGRDARYGGHRMSEHAFQARDVDVSPQDVQARHEAGEVQLIDVREDYEHAAGRIAGARHIVLARVASEAPTIDRDRPVVFYCRLGARSGMAANAFRRGGWEAYSMDGGLEAWDRAGLPLEPEGGRVADH